MARITQEEFGRVLRSVLWPSRAIEDAAHLKGRAAALRETAQALSAQGRQVFVHGFRGVGKSSVALTAAKAFSRTETPLLVFCSAGSDFGSIIRDMVASGLGMNPLEVEATSQSKLEGSGKLLGVGISGGALETKKYAGVPIPKSVNEAVHLLSKATAGSSTERVFVVDEFDLLTDPESHQSFGELIKLIADSGSSTKIIFCGVAEGLDQIFRAHQSTFRYLHPLRLETLKLQPCLEIIEDAEQRLGLSIEHNTKYRIVQISDGFPYFVHLITEKLLWQWFNDPNRCASKTSVEQYERALDDASSAAEPELRMSYDSVAKKYKADGELILWAMADGNLLSKNLDAIEHDFGLIYGRVEGALKPKQMLNRSQLSSRMAKMKALEYQSVLKSNGRGWYEFTEKRMRGYARLRAASREIYLRSDHPLG